MGPLSGGASSGFCIDWNGDVGFMYTYTYMFDPLKAEDPEHVLNTIDENFKNRYNASASIAGTKTNAKSISELAGNGADFGISGIPAGNLGIDASKCVGFEEGSCKIANHGTTIGVSVNANPSKPGVSYDFSYTGVEKMFNIFDLMHKIDDAILSW